MQQIESALTGTAKEFQCYQAGTQDLSTVKKALSKLTKALQNIDQRSDALLTLLVELTFHHDEELTHRDQLFWKLPLALNKLSLTEILQLFRALDQDSSRCLRHLEAVNTFHYTRSEAFGSFAVGRALHGLLPYSELLHLQRCLQFRIPTDTADGSQKVCRSRFQLGQTEADRQIVYQILKLRSVDLSEFQNLLEDSTVAQRREVLEAILAPVKTSSLARKV